jgi:hypothetical protein
MKHDAMAVNGRRFSGMVAEAQTMRNNRLWISAVVLGVLLAIWAMDRKRTSLLLGF